MTEVAERAEVPDGAVVVGVDGSPWSGQALSYAAEEASRRSAPLVVVRAWTLTTAPRPKDCPVGFVPSLLEYEGAVRDAVEEQVAKTLGEDHGLQLLIRPVHGRAVPAVIEASKQASLVVLGARGSGGFRGLLLGSVTEQVMRHAHSPVTVVREPEEVADGKAESS